MWNSAALLATYKYADLVELGSYEATSNIQENCYILWHCGSDVISFLVKHVLCDSLAVHELSAKEWETFGRNLNFCSYCSSVAFSSAAVRELIIYSLEISTGKSQDLFTSGEAERRY